jgi:hypothetical protein
MPMFPDMTPETVLLRIRREDLPLLLEAVENEIELLDEEDIQDAFTNLNFLRPRSPELQAKLDRLGHMANVIIAMSPLKKE